MTWWHQRSGWLLPSAIALLASILGAATNFATDMKSSWIAWLVVAILAIAVAAVTAASERGQSSESKPGGTILDDVSKSGHASHAFGLQMRRTQTSNPDGSIKIETEWFNEKLARQSLSENPLDEG